MQKSVQKWIVDGVFLVLLSVVLGMAGLCWTTWPAVAAASFMDELISANPDDGSEYTDQYGGMVIVEFVPDGPSSVIPQHATVTDLLLGRRRYKVYSNDFPGQWWQFVVQRGVIVSPGQDGLSGFDSP